MLARFIQWLDENKFRYELNGNGTSVFVLFDCGYYIRASDFRTDGTCYIRDTGFCEYTSVFELTQRVLNYKNREKENR